tara:strand:+ start:3936 stop:4253 length:318 start_codon:yes stop_codon:yes gene_type:complete
MSLYKKNERIECADGFSMSVQASKHNYCTPRIDDATVYTEVEIGFPNAYESLLAAYADDKEDYVGTVYGWVPLNVVTLVCAKHGGVMSGEMPSGIPYLKADDNTD